MDNKRRKFLKAVGLTAALGIGGGFPLCLEASYEPEPKDYVKDPKMLHGKRWGMVIDTRKFQTEEDFQRVIDACDKVHNIPKEVAHSRQDIKWIWKDEFERVFPSKQNPYLADRLSGKEFILLCNQCDNPPCVRVCPTKATFQREDGIVMMDYHRCIGCRYCMAACPYGSRSFNFCNPAPFVKDKNGDFPTRTRGVVEKCNFCAERLEQGLQPACVEASNGAIIFGDLADEDSHIRKVLRENFTIRRKVELGSNPCVFYIV
jgi:molybdopterin-containing oxidoreductase family iron-sulfur binding subunit